MEERASLKGSCLCGRVRYQAQGPLQWMARCHCVQCRKASGAEFATNASVDARTFSLLAGAELIGEFESSPGELRCFCRNCGSPLFKRSRKTPEQVRLRLGALDGELDQKPLFHVFVSEKPGWSEIHDSTPQFATLPAPGGTHRDS